MLQGETRRRGLDIDLGREAVRADGDPEPARGDFPSGLISRWFAGEGRKQKERYGQATAWRPQSRRDGSM